MIRKSLVTVVFAYLSAGLPKTFAADIAIEGYNFKVTDIAAKGITAQRLFNEQSTGWMDLEHSVCANRAHVWSYDIYRKYRVNTGTIFIFFGAKVWEGQKHKYWYHAGTYVVENGVEKVIEGSYPSEVSKPLTVVEWMDNEMEGRVNASKCVEIKKDADRDLTELFYFHSFLPNYRANGKPAYDCYFRKVPGYIPYPETTAELELGVDEDGQKIDYELKNFDKAILWNACVDAYVGKKYLKRAAARKFCDSYI